MDKDRTGHDSLEAGDRPDVDNKTGLIRSLSTALYSQAGSLAEKVEMQGGYDGALTEAILKVSKAAKELAVLGEQILSDPGPAPSTADMAEFYQDIEQRIERRAQERNRIWLAEKGQRSCPQCGADIGAVGAA